jgi:hypothetical protein
MLEIADVFRAIAAYQSGKTSLGEFADWLRSVSRRKFAESQEVRDAILEIDSLYSEVYFGEMPEGKFREELASAIRPFALPEQWVIAKVYRNVWADVRYAQMNPHGIQSAFAGSHAAFVMSGREVYDNIFEPAHSASQNGSATELLSERAEAVAV